MRDMPDTAPEFLITAEDAYPAFERMILAAQKDVMISMRLFDPATKLRSPEAKELGDTWSALIAHKLAGGVTFTVWITDFDPVARPDMHRYSWECLSRLKASGTASGRPERLTADVLMHPDRVPWPQRIALTPATRAKLQDTCDQLNSKTADDRDHALRYMPSLRPLLRNTGGTLAPRIWPPAPLVPATHHQKVAVVDGEHLYIGGLDLNPRRFDTKKHDQKSERTWHDVQVRVHDPVLAQAAKAHLEALRTGNVTKPVPGFLRTQSLATKGATGSLGPREVVHELEDAHLDLIANARDFIYVETQFLRSSTITNALVDAARRRPGLNLMVVLPAAPEDVAFDGSDGLDARYGEQLQGDAVSDVISAFGSRCAFLTPAQCRPGPTDGRDSFKGAPIVYVHAKVLIADATRALVSSANMNARSMRWDTEAGLLIDDRDDAARLFHQCRRHWLQGAPMANPKRATHWTTAARANAAAKPQERRHFLLPYDTEPAKEMGAHIPGMPEAMV
ncbi:MAG TPA: phospholipase [Maritimibacter sp.]|nr:phospholipase [Maritimibacter sp.]